MEVTECFVKTAVVPDSVNESRNIQFFIDDYFTQGYEFLTNIYSGIGDILALSNPGHHNCENENATGYYLKATWFHFNDMRSENSMRIRKSV